MIFFELDELNVILRMNFLTKYHTVLGFFNKEVVLKDLQRSEVKLLGNKKVKLVGNISVLKAEKLIKKGHTAYPNLVMDTQAL